LFVPLAEAVVFAMLASYLLSRTLVPTLAIYLLKAKDHSVSGNLFTRFQRGFERVYRAYQLLLTRPVLHRRIFVPVFLLLCLSALLLVPWLGQDFFPSTDEATLFCMCEEDGNAY
jgi:multidrug efflux pump subunit AcrB